VSLAPRVVIVHRHTELEELLARHGTRGQASFYLRTRGRRIENLEARHQKQAAAMAEVSSAIPADWRRGMVERADLSRFLFSPEDIVVAVGQDGLVANLAKYLDGQLIIGIDPEPLRNPGVLVAHPPGACAGLLALAAGGGGEPGEGTRARRLTMVTAETDDGQQLTGLNEIYLGQPTHQTARYTLRLPDGRAEAQASSGLIVSTGTGATGWCRSAWLERKSPLVLPAPEEDRLAWFIREAWPSPATGTACTEGTLSAGQEMEVTAESDRLVLFGDGIEADTIPLTWGQSARLRLADRFLRLL
jgi:NAD kinase